MKVGDVVSLKSFGANMTVEKIIKGLVTCVWFDEAGHVQRGKFAKGILQELHLLSDDDE
jgi:uncharacterized protein YodC (DUF2158 family)